MQMFPKIKTRPTKLIQVSLGASTRTIKHTFVYDLSKNMLLGP